MEIFGNIADLLTGGTVGAAGGLLGSIFGFGKAWLDKRHQLKVMEIDRKEKAADRAHDLELMDREAEIDLAKTAAEITGRMNEADLENIHASIEAEAKEQKTLRTMAGKLGKFSGALAALLLFFAEFIRKMMRPLITVSLLAATFKIWSALGVDVTSLDVDKRLTLMTGVVDMILFLTSVAVCFWFLSRPQAGREMPHKIG